MGLEQLEDQQMIIKIHYIISTVTFWSLVHIYLFFMKINLYEFELNCDFIKYMF